MSRRAGFVGLRLAGASALLAVAPILAALGAWQILQPEQASSIDALQEAVTEGQAAGEVALGALEAADAALAEAHEGAKRARRALVERRASELALLQLRGAIPSELAPKPPEAVGRLWPAQDRMQGLGATTTTLSVARAELAAALRAAPKGVLGPLLVRAEPGVFAVARRSADSAEWAAAFVPLPAPTPGPSLGAARSAVGSLAAVEAPPLVARRPELLLALAAVLGALLVFLWTRFRVSSPLLDTLEAARDFVHGDPSARADAERGAREAREVARAVNGLVERAVRLESQGRAARDEDIQAAAVAIEALGKGDLRQVTPRLNPPFGPLSRALDRARRDLLGRVERLHEVSLAVAKDAATIAPAAGRLSNVAGGQTESLERLGEGLTEAERAVGDVEPNLRTALDGLTTAAAEQRRATQDLKAAVSLVSRRLTDVSAVSARLQGMLTSAQSLEAALSMLGTWAASGGPAEGQGARATQLVGEGRAAIAELTSELSEAQDELSRAAESLQTLAEASLEAPPDPGRAAAKPLYDAASGLVRASELLGRGLAGWTRGARTGAQDFEVVARAAEATGARLPELSEAFSELRVGDAFETVLLERLERAQAEIADAGEDGLTPDGAAMLEQVNEAAEAAKARVAQLLRATEATLDVLRR